MGHTGTGADAAHARQELLRAALRDTGAEPARGPLLVPLPSVAMVVVAEVEHVSPVGGHRFSRIALGDADGALDPAPDPDELAGALRTELAARAGAAPAGSGPLPDAVDPGAGAPADAVDRVLDGLRRTSGELPEPELTDTALVRELLPMVATGEPDRRTEDARLDALAARLAEARDTERCTRVRGLVERWLSGGHLWRRPVLHPAPWQRIRNPLRPEPVVAVADPPVPGRAGRFRLRRARPYGDDLRTVAGWMRRPEVVRFFGQPWSDPRWARELAGHGPGSGTAAVLAEDGGPEPVGYLEFYRPVRHALARSFPAGPEDLGVHVCVGAPHRRGTGSELLAGVAEALLAAEPGCPRIIAEPDARNAAAVGAFRRAGFTDAARIALPHKDAAIMVRERG